MMFKKYILSKFSGLETRYKYYLLLIAAIILIGILLRLVFINHFIYYDEMLMVKSGTDGLLYNYYLSNQPPLPIFLYIFSTTMIGASTFALRLPILLFWISNAIIFLKILKIQKRTKLFTIISMIVYISSIYGIFSSMQINQDGQILLFFFLLAILSFLKYEKTRKFYHLLLTGIFIGFGLLTKVPAILIIPVLFFSRFFNIIQANFENLKKYKFKSFFKIFPEFLVICFTAFLIFGVYVLIYLGLGDETVRRVLSHSYRHLAFESIPDIFSFITSAANALIWISPLFLVSSILGLPYFIRDKEDRLFFVWIAFVLIFYFFILDVFHKPFEKHLTILIPAWSVLTSTVLIKYIAPLVKKITLKKVLISLAFLTIIFIFVLLVLNHYTADYLTFHPRSDYAERTFDLNWGFFFPVTGMVGPVGFYLSFLSFGVTLILTAVLFMGILISFLLKKRMISASLFLMLLSLSSAYSIYVYSEFAFGTFNPNMNDISWETAEYLEQNKQLEPVYIFRNNAFPHYLSSYKEKIMVDFDKEYNVSFAENLAETDATVVIINFPLLSDESPLLQNLEKCKKVKVFYEKGQALSTIYRCGNQE